MGLEDTLLIHRYSNGEKKKNRKRRRKKVNCNDMH